MENEERMIAMLEKIMDKQDEHSEILGEHGRLLGEHGRLLGEHGKILGEYREILGNHSSQLEENGHILKAVRSGQEHLKAELDGMKISNAKEIGEMKKEGKTVSINQKLLRDETWENDGDGLIRVKIPQDTSTCMTS